MKVDDELKQVSLSVLAAFGLRGILLGTKKVLCPSLCSSPFRIGISGKMQGRKDIASPNVPGSPLVAESSLESLCPHVFTFIRISVAWTQSLV